MKCLTLLLALCGFSAGQGLSVNYADRGIQTIAFNGVKLTDVGANPADAFSIRHMRMTDAKGKEDGQHGWGDNYKERSFNKTTHTIKTVYDWGSIAVQFSTSKDTLTALVTETNDPKSSLTLQGAAIYLVNFRFPKLPLGWENLSYPQVAYSTFGPSVITGDWQSGEVNAIDPSVTDKLYVGFMNDGSGKPNYYPVASTIPPDGLPSFAPQYSVAVPPGHTYHFKLALRFAPSGTAHAQIAPDVYSAWAKTYPLFTSVKNWDRRPIGTVFLASSPSGKDVTQPAGCGANSGNPRNYFHDCKMNVHTPAGLQAFQTRVLKVAQTVVTNVQKHDWQGAITWDIEGEEWPQATSYVCSPDQIAQIAPEMESLVTGQTGNLAAYNGHKLDDAYFEIQTSNGLKVGVCTRPQQFALQQNGSATQNYVSDAKAADLLNRKMRFAKSRWGVTMFYADTMVHADGGNLEPAYIRRMMRGNPESLLMPEINSQQYAVPAAFQYSAPLYNFEYHTDLGTPADVPDIYNVYPARHVNGMVEGPFGVNLVNDVKVGALTQNRRALIKAATEGDIMMGHADYDQANDTAIEEIYKAAESSGPASGGGR